MTIILEVMGVCQIMPTEMNFMSQEKAWLGGFIDGEGCFSLMTYVDKRKNGEWLNRRPTFQISQCRKNAIGIKKTSDILRELGINHQRYTNKKTKVKEVRVANFNVKKMIEVLLPHLIVKKQVAEHTLKFWDFGRKIIKTQNQYMKFAVLNVDVEQIEEFASWMDGFRELNDTKANHVWTGKKVLEFYREQIRVENNKNSKINLNWKCKK